MMAGPVSEQTPISTGRAQAHTRLAKWAVGLAGATAVMVSVGAAVFGVAYAVGGVGATEDNWVGLLTVTSLFGGLITSLTAFALAVTVKVKHERWTLLWLPLAVFPVLVAFLVLGEAFWWE